MRISDWSSDVCSFDLASLTTRMSEWIVLQCLSHLRQVPIYSKQQREHVWRELPQPEAKDLTVGIMGLGVLGQDSVVKLKVMGFDVIGWSDRKSTRLNSSH